MNIGGTEFKFRSSQERKNLVIVFLIIWLALLTVLVVVGGLAILGKFSRIGRDRHDLVNQFYEDIDEIHGVVDSFLVDFKNLKNQVENLKETVENPSTVSEQLENLENRIAQLQETQNSLRQDVNLLLRGDEERPVLQPATTPNKGGRPPKKVER